MLLLFLFPFALIALTSAWATPPRVRRDSEPNQGMNLNATQFLVNTSWCLNMAEDLSSFKAFGYEALMRLELSVLVSLWCQPFIRLNPLQMNNSDSVSLPRICNSTNSMNIMNHILGQGLPAEEATGGTSASFSEVASSSMIPVTTILPSISGRSFPSEGADSFGPSITTPIVTGQLSLMPQVQTITTVVTVTPSGIA